MIFKEAANTMRLFAAMTAWMYEVVGTPGV